MVVVFHRLWKKQQQFDSAKMKSLFAESGQHQQRIFQEDEAVCAPHWMEVPRPERMCGRLSSIRERERDAGVDVYTVCETRQVGEIPFSAFPNLCHLEDGSKKAVEEHENNNNITQPCFFDK